MARYIRDTREESSGSRATKAVVTLALPLILTLIVFPLVTALATPRTLYLDSDGVPGASLSTASPTSGALSNLDPGRDDEPGLLLQKSNQGVGESDPAKHQIWVAAPRALDLEGPASFTFWSTMKDFTNGKKGEVNAYLLDCDPAGNDCTLIESATEKSKPWADTEYWAPHTISFGTINYSIADGRSLALKVTVNNGSQDDMWFAYDTVTYPSRLIIELAASTTTTLPTTTTTTTTPPPATTTTTTPPPATSTTTTTTTTSAPTTSSTTTTTTTEPASEDLGQTSTTTTTDAPPGGESLPEPPEHDAAMTAIPNLGQAEPPTGSGMTRALTEGLEVVIPPLAATALVSPLILIEALLAAFVETGRDLVIPAVALFVASLWMTRSLHRSDLDLPGDSTS